VNGKILLIHISHLKKTQENFFKEKNTYGHPSVCVATEGSHVTDEQNWMVIKTHFNIVPVYSVRRLTWKDFAFLPLGKIQNV
jgi:hypothetical protein